MSDTLRPRAEPPLTDQEELDAEELACSYMRIILTYRPSVRVMLRSIELLVREILKSQTERRPTLRVVPNA